MTQLVNGKRSDVASFFEQMNAQRPALRAKMLASGIDEKKLDEEEKEVLLEVAARFGRNHFWFFVTEILGWEGLDVDYHGKMCDFMERQGESKLVLAPRGHLKSTLCTVAYSLWRAVKNPEVRVLIANYKLQNAQAFLFQIRTELVRERFGAFYPGLVPNLKNVKWNESQITVRRKNNPKEATFEVTGVGGEITGKHYDVMLFDDIQGPENVGTLEQLNKLRTWWNQMQAILEPGGDQALVGTRWHYADIYGFILENLQNDFQILQTDVYQADEVTPVWPRKFTVEVLKKIEDRMCSDPRQGRALWLAQYRNKIIDEVNAAFKQGKMKFFNDDSTPKSLGVTISLDPAISEKEGADRSAITVRGVSENNHWYVLEVWAQRGVAPSVLVDKLFEIFVKWNARYFVSGVGVEAIAYQKSLMFSIRDEMMKRNVFMPIIELGNWRTSKELRIRGLVPRYDQGAILFRKPTDSGDDTAILLDEMMKFPKSEHDDCLDSLAMHMEMEAVASEMYVPQVSEDAPVNGRDRYGYPVREEHTSPYASFL